MPFATTGPNDGLGEKFVRVTGTRQPDLVEFDFAIGDPRLHVELLLPKAAFEEFCRDQRVTFLAPVGDEPDPSDCNWSLRLAQARRFR